MSIFSFKRKTKLPWRELTLDQIRQRAKILVVDDEPFPYDELFRRDGYSIQCWVDVESLDRMTDDTFDLIFLDMSGIGRDHAKTDQGFGVLRHVKERAPWKAVIAYSGKKWSFRQHDDLRLAELLLDKGLDYVDV